MLSLFSFDNGTKDPSSTGPKGPLLMLVWHKLSSLMGP